MRLRRSRRIPAVLFGLVALLSAGALARVESAPGGPPRPRRALVAAHGAQLSRPNVIAVDAAGAVTVLDEGAIAVLDLDPATGALTIVSDIHHGSGAPLPQDIEPGIFTPGGIEAAAIDANGDRLVVGMNGMLRIDRSTGERTVIASNTVGSGPSVNHASSLAVETAGTILVAHTFGGVVRVDPLTGVRTTVTGGGGTTSVGTGMALHRPEGIALRDDGVFYLADTSVVLRVDPVTGDRTVVAGRTAETGPVQVLGRPTALALERSGMLVWAQQEGLLRVDPATGERAPLSGFGAGAGPAFRYVADVAVEPGGTLLVADRGLGAVVRVDPASGDRTVLAGGPIGKGPVFGTCLGGSALEAAGTLAVTDCGEGIFRVDVASGDRSILSGRRRGRGPGFAGPVEVAVERSGNLLVIDALSVTRVNGVTGNRTTVASGASGTPLIAGTSVRIGPDGGVLIADAGQFVAPGAGLYVFPLQLYAGLLRLDLATGGSETLSGGGPLSADVGRGPSFILPIRAMDFEPGGATAAVIRGNTLVRVDLATGNRRLLFALAQDTWESFVDLAVDVDGTWLVLDGHFNRIVRFDPASRTQTIVSGLTVGAGPQLEFPTNLHRARDGRIYVTNFGRYWDFGDRPYATIIAVDPATGNRTIVSRP